MRGSTHLAGGLLAGALVASRVGIEPGLSVGVAALDVIPPILLAGIVALVPDWIQVNVPGGSNIIRGTFGHRGISHWLITALAVWGAVRVLAPGVAWFVLAGWISHIILDLFAGGVSAFFPISKRVTLASIKTGGTLDTITGAACLVIASTIIIGVVL